MRSTLAERKKMSEGELILLTLKEYKKKYDVDLGYISSFIGVDKNVDCSSFQSDLVIRLEYRNCDIVFGSNGTQITIKIFDKNKLLLFDGVSENTNFRVAIERDTLFAIREIDAKVPITPIEFFRRMNTIDCIYDEEERHIQADRLMVKTLCSLGYETGCNIFTGMKKEY